MGFQLSIVPHTLQFRFSARTSRGAISEHQVWYVVLRTSEEPEKIGIGECAPLPGLSVDFETVSKGLSHFLTGFKEQNCRTLADVEAFLLAVSTAEWPAFKFALETALLDYRNGGSRILFPSEFTEGTKPIPINGLIWMSEKSEMLRQIKEKLGQGYSCLKLKIGSLDFEQELEVLKFIRKEFGGADLTLRVDANGAFSVPEAMEKLHRLAAYTLHSIEQPIKAGQWEEMAKLCEQSPVNIALDEELIGEQNTAYKKELLSAIKPPFIILKPTLVGGLASAEEWMEEAEKQGIGWWMTSALESNIGLNAIAQFTAVNRPKLPQGLGTGQLYHNNVGSPLRVHKGYLHFDAEQFWDLGPITKV